MEQETDSKPIINPHLATDELRAMYPDVDFDTQEASEDRRRLITRYIRHNGRDQRLLLALIFSATSPKGAHTIKKDIFRHYREDLEEAVRNHSDMEFIDVELIRAIVHRYAPIRNAEEVCLNLMNENSLLLTKFTAADTLCKEQAVEITRLRDRVDSMLQAPAGQAKAKSRGSASINAKASENSEGSENSENPEDGRPATKEDLYAYYSERALEALKKAKPGLMSSLAMAMPDKDARSMFIDSIPAPNDCDELVNTLFRPACDCGAMKPAIARELTWSDYIYDLLDFPKPVKPRQVDIRLKAFFEEYLLTKK